MKINELRITHFGKLHNVNIKLEDGINLIEGSNESGKSTIHAFIGAMLFGNERARGRASKDDPYVKYQPWDTPGAYQGAMDFEYKGVKYSLVRVFYQKERSCTLTEIETGRQIKLPDERITSFIPELTETAYRNTVSAMQLHVRTDDALAKEVQNYIANLSLTGDSEVDVATAIDELNTKRKQLERSVKQDRIDELEQQCRRDRQLEEQMNALAQRLGMLEKEKKQQSEDLNKLLESEKYKQTQSVHELPVLVERYKNYQAQCAEADACVRRIDELAKGINNDEELRDKERALKSEHEELINVEPDYSSSRVRSGMQKSLLLAIFGVIAFAVLVNRVSVLAAVSVLIVIVAVAVVMMASLFGKERKRRFALHKSEEERERRLKEIDNLLAECAARRAHSDEQRQRMQEYERELERRNNICSKLRDELLYELSKYGEKPELTDEYIYELERSIRLTSESIFASKRSLEADIASLEQQLSPIRWELERYAQSETDAIDREQELRELLACREAAQIELEAVKLAIATIKELTGSIHDRFGKKLNELLSQITAHVTDNAYTQAVIDENLNIQLRDNAQFIPLEKLSAGTIEQIFLALRLSLSEVFFEDINMVKLLDESFVYFDKERLESAVRYLAENVKSQIIIFTCHDRERKVLDEIGARYNLIQRN